MNRNQITATVIRSNDYGLVVLQDDAGHQYALTTDKVKGDSCSDKKLEQGSRVDAVVEGEIVVEARRA